MYTSSSTNDSGLLSLLLYLSLLYIVSLNITKSWFLSNSFILAFLSQVTILLYSLKESS